MVYSTNYTMRKNKLRQFFSVLKYQFILRLWRLDKYQRNLHKYPFTRKLLKGGLDETPENNEAIIVPVGETITGGNSVVLPFQYLLPLVEKAGGYFILGNCPCRNAADCGSAPADFGCLYLGEATALLSEKIGRRINAVGAKAHIERALALGLVPMIVHASFDADMLSLPYRKMLAVCFCCDCCCTVRNHMRLGPSTFDDTIKRMPGLQVEIGAPCNACGECHLVCPVSAIHFGEAGISEIDPGLCKGCGLCVQVCPQEAPVLVLDESVDVMAHLIERIRQRTDVGI
jgi:UDP-glucose 4-epimerase